MQNVTHKSEHAYSSRRLMGMVVLLLDAHFTTGSVNRMLYVLLYRKSHLLYYLMFHFYFSS